jgi:hypothetical protein
MNRKKAKKGDVFTFVMLSLKEILEKKPPLAKMKEEVNLMGFSIRPIEGDPQIMKNIDDRQFIETLWTIGTIDGLMEKNFYRLSGEQKEIVLNALSKIKENLILKAKIKPEMMEEFDQETPPYLMLEIFRKQPLKKNIN